MLTRILGSVLAVILLSAISLPAAAYSYWLDSRYDLNQAHYRTAEEACYFGELMRSVDTKRATNQARPVWYHITYLDSSEAFCQVLYEYFQSPIWVPIGYTTSVYGTSATSPPCNIGGTADPETGLCSIPKCDGRCPPSGGNGSNPVDSANGNKFQYETDYVGSGAFQIAFERYYNSMRTFDRQDYPIGTGWSHSYGGFLSQIVNASNVVNKIRVYRANGAVQLFAFNGTAWVTDADTPERLAVNLSGGVLASATYTRADDTVETYNADGRLISIRRRDGLTQTLSYTTASGLTSPYVQKVTDPNGRTLTFSYTGSRLTGITDSAGIAIQFGYTGSNLGSVTYPVPGGTVIRSYFYNEPGQTGGVSRPYALTGIVDERLDRHASWGYDSSGRANLSVHGPYATGTADRTQFVFNANGTSTITSSLGAVRAYGFFASYHVARLASMNLPCDTCEGAAQSRSYDAIGYPNITTDFRGTTLDQDFNPRGLETQRIEALNDATGQKRTIQTDWNATFRVPDERRTLDSDGILVAKQTWTYNTRGQALTASGIDPDTGTTRTTTMVYCEQADVNAGTCPLVGLVRSVDGPRTDASDLTTYTYYQTDDATCATAPTTCPHRKGDLWKVTNAIGQVTETLSYDGAGRVLSIKDPNGVVTDFEYHPRGWLTARKLRGSNAGSEFDDRITRIEYWPTGLVKQVTQPDGSYTAYTYDAAHRLTDIADNAGNTIHYTLDAAGNRVQEDTKDPSATLTRTLTRIYNSLGRLETQADAQANPTDFIYDNNGNTDTVTDALSRVTDNDYDPLNRLSRTLQDVAGIAAETQFQYDALDNLTKVTDPKGLETNYTYNGLSELLQLQSPDTGTTIHTYDSGGNRQTQIDARGVTATYGYDALNRLTGIAYPTASLNVVYTYDTVQPGCAAGEKFPKGRLVKLTDRSGTTRYCYDRFGELVRKTQVVNGKTFTVRYAYTKAGQLSRLTYPDGARADYTRDALGHATEVQVTPAGGATQTLLTQAAYAPFGPAIGWTYGDGRTLSRPLDLNYRPASVFDGNPGGLSLAFGFDPVGNLDTLEDGLQSQTLARYRYDALNRLDQTQDGPTGIPIETYGYDATGNRSSLTNAGGTTAYTYPGTSHRLSSVGAVARGYDANGNTTSIGGAARTFVYDNSNRMSQTKVNGSVRMNYVYNGKGEQVRRYLGTANTYTAYDEAGHWLGEYNTAGAPIQQAIWLDDLPVGVVSDKLYSIEPDHLGTPRAVIDPTRNVAVWRWDLNGEAFGNTAPNQDPDGDSTAFVFNLRYPGQRYDAASGLNYNYFRDYEPGTGRYLESDPKGLRGDIATYSYAASKPLIYMDSDGQEPIPVGCDGAYGITLCDGQGGFETRVCKQGCMANCVKVHEETHKIDFLIKAPARCIGRKKGDNPTTEADMRPPYQWYRFECRAFRAGKKCAENYNKEKMVCLSPDCQQDIDRYIDNANYYLARWRCDAYGW